MLPNNGRKIIRWMGYSHWVYIYMAGVVFSQTVVIRNQLATIQTPTFGILINITFDFNSIKLHQDGNH